MLSPEMMRAAQEMMGKLSPEQLAALQRQAASLPPEAIQQMQSAMGGMSAADIRQATDVAASMPPEAFNAAAASAAAGVPSASAATPGAGSLPPQQEYQYTASMQLKNEGNALHGAGRYADAAAKYERALANLEGHAAAKSAALRLSCQANLASCALALRDWARCATLCGAVLAADPSNRKALYRRGQARAELGLAAGAVTDLQRALELSPEGDKPAVAAKLEEARQKAAHAERGVVIEEVEDEEEATTAPAAPAAAKAPAPAAAAGGSGMAQPTPEPAGSAGGSADPEHAQRMAADLLKSDPGLAKAAADRMAGMSDAELAAHLARSGGMGANMTPAMARAAADTMKNMPPEQLQAMAAQASASGAGHGGAHAAPHAPGAMPAGMAEQLRRNPEMLKSSIKMMESMPPEQLEAMVSAMPGMPPGMKVDTAQLRMAAKMMETMSPEDIERMTVMAQQAQQAGSVPPPAATAASATPAPAAPAAAAPAVGAPGAAALPAGVAEELRRNPDMLKTSIKMMESMPPEQLEAMMAAVPGAPKVDAAQLRMAAKMMETMSPEDIERMATAGQAGGPGGAGGAGGAAPGGLAGGLGAMSPEMIAAMRKQASDPAMMRSMREMMRGMDPEALAAMMSQGGMKVTPEQAKRMADQMGGMSDGQLEAMARVAGWIGAVVEAAQRLRRWALSHGALVAALAVLLLALLLRWLGWV